MENSNIFYKKSEPQYTGVAREEKDFMQNNSVFGIASLLLLMFLIVQILVWGGLVIRPPQTITVTGMAESQENNQVASFYAGASAMNKDKQAAISEVNAKVQEVTVKLKEFGVDAADIQTQNLSVYQEQEQYNDEGAQRFRPGTWRATNSLSITLKDIGRASELVEMLAASGLTDISGPNFRMDNTSEAETKLLNAAVANATAKAELIASEQQKKVSKVISISEGTGQNSLFPMFTRDGAGGGGMPIEPGSSTVRSVVTVTFEVR